MAITRKEKEGMVAQLKELFEGSLAVIAADNQGLTVEEATQLRERAREAGCIVRVAKNRLIKLALQEAGRGGFESYLSGPTILITHSEDPVVPAKIFMDFAKEHERLQLKGGLLRRDVLDAAGVIRLAKLPGREQLRSEFAGIVNSLLGVVYFNAQNLLGEFSGLLEAQKERMAKAA